MAEADAVPAPKRQKIDGEGTPSKFVEKQSLLNKVAIVTGSSEGIGAGIALELARAGADVCINYTRSTAAAEDVAAQCRETGRKAIICECDVSDRGSVENMFVATEKELGPISILVTNAVRSTRENILETKFEDFQACIGVGLYGVFHCMQLAARRMVEAGTKGASMIHISSPHVRGPFKGCIDYNVAKAASHHLALSVANELMWKGIRVNIVQPGWTDTPGERRLYGDELLEKSGQGMPFKRLGSPLDCAKAVVWLASDEAEYVTGANITVDGGQFIETAASWKEGDFHS